MSALKPNKPIDWTALRHRRYSAPCAVVAGIDVNGLGVVRSLGAEGVPLIAIDTDLAKPSAATRFGTKICVEALSGPRFVDVLMRIAETMAEKPVLFLTQEDSVETVATARDLLQRCYRFSMPEADVMRTLMDKALFQAAAEKLRSPIPRSMRLTANAERASFESLRFPCVIKPLTKDAAYSVRFKKAYKVSNVAEIWAIWLQVCDVVDEMIVQEWIEGGDSDVYFCLQYRPALKAPPISFVGRKICQWPPDVGGTASCVAAPEAQSELDSLTNAFFDAVGFVGLGSMEYKRDARDGRFYMVEPTVGRTDYQEEVATLNGVNIPYAAYCAEIGREIPGAKKAALPHVWRDWASYTKARTAGAPDPVAVIAPNAKIVDAYMRADDILPFMSMQLEPVRRRLKRLFVGR